MYPKSYKGSSWKIVVQFHTRSLGDWVQVRVLSTQGPKLRKCKPSKIFTFGVYLANKALMRYRKKKAQKLLKLRENRRNNSQHCWANNVDRFQIFRNDSQQHATTCNRVCKQKQYVTSKNVASVCTRI